MAMAKKKNNKTFKDGRKVASKVGGLDLEGKGIKNPVGFIRWLAKKNGASKGRKKAAIEKQIGSMKMAAKGSKKLKAKTSAIPKLKKGFGTKKKSK